MCIIKIFSCRKYYGCPFKALAFGARFVFETFKRATTYARLEVSEIYNVWNSGMETEEHVFQREIVCYIGKVYSSSLY